MTVWYLYFVTVRCVKAVTRENSMHLSDGNKMALREAERTVVTAITQKRVLGYERGGCWFGQCYVWRRSVIEVDAVLPRQDRFPQRKRTQMTTNQMLFERLVEAECHRRCSGVDERNRRESVAQNQVDFVDGFTPHRARHQWRHQRRVEHLEVWHLQRAHGWRRHHDGRHHVRRHDQPRGGASCRLDVAGRPKGGYDAL